MKKVFCFILFLVFSSPFTAFADFPSPPDDAQSFWMGHYMWTAHMYIWSQDSTLYVRVEPETAEFDFDCSYFTVWQYNQRFDYLTFRQESGDTFCAKIINTGMTVILESSNDSYFDPGKTLTVIIADTITREITPSDQTSALTDLPRSGWWWNSNHPGRGINIEIQGNMLFMAFYAYDGETGEALWYSSGGEMTDENHYTGRLLRYRNGQCLGCYWQPPDPAEDVGEVKLTFHSDSSATVSCPYMTTNITRFVFGP